MRHAYMFAVFTFVALGCSVYQHEVDLRVQDPHRVWIEPGQSGTRIDPLGPESGARLPGTHDLVEREESGAVRVGGREVLGRNGAIPAVPATLDETSRDGDVFRFPECYRYGRRGVGCKRTVMLATPWSNVTMAREADVPATWLGVLEILGGVGAATGGVFAARDYPYASGGSLLIGAGVVGVIAGIIQLSQPVQNGRDSLP